MLLMEAMRRAIMRSLPFLKAAEVVLGKALLELSLLVYLLPGLPGLNLGTMIQRTCTIDKLRLEIVLPRSRQMACDTLFQATKDCHF